MCFSTTCVEVLTKHLICDSTADEATIIALGKRLARCKEMYGSSLNVLYSLMASDDSDENENEVE